MVTDKKWKNFCFPPTRVALISVLVAAAVSYPFFVAFEMISLWRAFLFLLLLCFPAAEDYKTGYISDIYSLAIGATGICFSIWNGHWSGLWSAAAVFLFFFCLCRWKPDAMGMGDAGLAAAISLWLPGLAAFLFVYLSFLLGSVCGIFLMLRKKKSPADGLPFAPFLSLSGGVIYIWGNEVIRWYETFL